MSLGAWGDGGDMDGHEGYITEERAEEMFREGLQAMREMLARFVEQGGDATTAASIRANWNPSWGKDPGRPDEIQKDAWS
jgi:hypothetical protein